MGPHKRHVWAEPWVPREHPNLVSWLVQASLALGSFGMSMCSFPPSLQSLCSLFGLKNQTLLYSPTPEGSASHPRPSKVQAWSSCRELLPGGVGRKEQKT